MTHYTTITLPSDKEVDVCVTWSVQNDGIGSYEYWGFCGYDAGTDYPEIDDIDPEFTDESEAEQQEIIDFIKGNFENLCRDIESEIERTEPDGY